MARTRTPRLLTAIAVAAVGAQLLALQPAGAAMLPTPSPTPAARAATKVIGADGTVDAAAYRKLATTMASTAGIAYRFGNAATAANTATTIWKPTSKPFVTTTSTSRSYQVGAGQQSMQRDFSSNQGQVGYLPSASSPRAGVDVIETLNTDEGVFSEKPQLSWTYGGAGHPDPDTQPTSASGTCIARTGRTNGTLVAQARAYSLGESTANSILAFSNGVISAAGTNTAHGSTCTTLPKNLRPTDVSVTNSNEFALVTAWNTTKLRSELVVIALGDRRPAGDFWNFEWSELYPGFRNYGMPNFMKVLGSVVLPMKAATSVSAVTDIPVQRLLVHQGNGSSGLLGQTPLSNEANRQTFATGKNANTVAKAGYALVASREEKKVAFVDLQPLIDNVTRAYLGSRSTFDTITRSIGPGANQWPYAFSAAPKERPAVVKTIHTSSAPSAVAGMLDGAVTPRAYVATADGVLHTYAVKGLATSSAASPASIKQVGSIAVGKNPTNITYVKERATGDAVKQTIDDTLIVTARGSRAVQWVKLAGNAGSVVRTLRDSRLKDPIAAEDNNTHGAESYVLTVADFGGAQVANYRYGPVVFHTNGGATYGVGRDGKAQFEFGGAYKPGGRPWSISITNVS